MSTFIQSLRISIGILTSSLIIINILFVGLVHSQSSIIKNGGFEEGFAYWIDMYGGDWDLDNVIRHSGQYSAHATGYNAFLYQVLSVSDGTIRWSFWAKGTEGTLYPEVVIDTPGRRYFFPWTVHPSSDWNSHEFDFDISQAFEEHGISEATVWVAYNLQGGEVWIDDTDVLHYPPSPPPVPEGNLSVFLVLGGAFVLIYLWKNLPK